MCTGHGTLSHSILLERLGDLADKELDNRTAPWRSICSDLGDNVLHFTSPPGYGARNKAICSLAIFFTLCFF